ncbi:uncharacterized protein LOC123529270 [Mercenaria mercenaria]|uniref:uncharacterized protein LOC123529270 n=1 Tax=Mercenaria mercenaria TaxID=6596 RepID=UPI00234EB694|nr:uncharacterized protein LOC123529270 [Mercenaria mercenaria]
MPALTLKKFSLYIFIFVLMCAGLFLLIPSFKRDKGKFVYFKPRDKQTTCSCNVIKDNKHIDKSKSISKPFTKDVIFEKEIIKLNKKRVGADDRRLVELIRDYYLVAPSNLPYRLNSPGALDNSRGQAPFIDSRLHYKEKGFYVESGAYDGESLSNTLMFERMRNWDGILIEPNPAAFAKLMKKNRRSYAVNACLSTEPYPSKKMITDDFLQARTFPQKSSKKRKTNKKSFLVQCFPLYSILLALNYTTIDYLSLDVEGDERGVLETIPWDKVNIDIMSVEYDKWPGGSRLLCKYMNNKGYECLVTMSGKFISDVILKKKSARKRGLRNAASNNRHKNGSISAINK